MCLGVKGRLLITLGCNQSPVPPDSGGIVLEIAVVQRDDTTGAVEHGRVDVTLDAACRQQVFLFLLHLFHQLRLVPSLQRFRQVLLLAAYHPARSLGGQRKTDEVGITVSQPLLHLGGVAAHLHAQTDPQFVGQPLRQQIVCTQVTATIVVVRLRTCQCQRNQLTVALDIVKVEVVVLGQVVGYLTPRCHHGFLLFRSARNEEQESQYVIKIRFHGCKITKLL